MANRPELMIGGAFLTALLIISLEIYFTQNGGHYLWTAFFSFLEFSLLSFCAYSVFKIPQASQSNLEMKLNKFLGLGFLALAISQVAQPGEDLLNYLLQDQHTAQFVATLIFVLTAASMVLYGATVLFHNRKTTASK